MPVIESVELTVNCTPLLVTPSTVTVTGPLVAFDGTWAVTLVLLQEVTLCTIPMNLTWLMPWLAPKPRPFKVIKAPICAAGGARLVMVGVITLNETLEGTGTEFTVTLTGPTPGTAVLGTLATICVLVQLAMDVATPPLKLSVLLP